MKNPLATLGLALLAAIFAASASAQDGLTITEPERGTVWVEGREGVVRWEAGGTGQFCIALRVGGKDLGLLNDCDTDAAAGEFRWTIPEGRLTGFGPDIMRDVHVGLFRADGQGAPVESPGFTVVGHEPAPHTSAAEAIGAYYEALDGGDYHAAYGLLSPFRIALAAPTGSQLAYQPRPDFFTFEDNVSAYLTGVEVLSIEEITDPARWFDDPRIALGIRSFTVRLRETHPGNNVSEAEYFVDVAGGLPPARGETGAVWHILGIGTGP